MRAWTVAVILWGAFVRATGSGAGCGDHWPLCNGEVLPQSPAMTTIIEFMHRITSGVALISVAGLVWGARRSFPAGHRVRKAAWGSLFFILVEALLGAGLVLLRYVDKNESWGRAIYLCAHMTNTLLLLAVIAAVAVWARGDAPSFSWSALSPWIKGAFAAALLAATTGVVAALGDTIWPAASLTEGIRAEFSGTAPALLRLRLVHPVIASLTGLYILLASIVATKGATRSRLLAICVIQLVAGGLNVVLLAPVWMQILHLALACAVWLALVMAGLQGSPLSRPAIRESAAATPQSAGRI